jgi:hypothetical protein
MSVPSTMIHMNSITYIYIQTHTHTHRVHGFILNKFLVPDSSVSIATSYGLDSPGNESR